MPNRLVFSAWWTWGAWGLRLRSAHSSSDVALSGQPHWKVIPESSANSPWLLSLRSCRAPGHPRESPVRPPGPEAASSGSHPQSMSQRHRSCTGLSPFRSWSQGHLRRAVPDTPGEPCLRGGRSSRGPCPSTVPALAGDSGIVVTLPLATYRYFTMIQETLTHRSGSSDCIVDTMRLFGDSLPFARGKPVGAHTRRLLKIFSLHLCISDGMCRISSLSPGARPAGWKVTAEGQFRVAAAAGWQLLRAGVAGRPAAGRAASFRLPRPPAANRPHPRSRPGLRPSGC